jgi:hypothetical protein
MFAPPAIMKPDLQRRAREIVSRTLSDADEPEMDRLLIGDAVVVREGTHYRIETGGDPWTALERPEPPDGRCDCGEPLSSRGPRWHCRSCGREYEPLTRQPAGSISR